jgi:hypothetical protein
MRVSDGDVVVCVEGHGTSVDLTLRGDTPAELAPIVGRLGRIKAEVEAERRIGT